MAKRQPKCGACNHPITFHPGHKRCKAMGCKCVIFVAQPEE